MTNGPCDDCDFKSKCRAFRTLSDDLFDKPGFQKPAELSSLDRALDRFVSNFITSLLELKARGSIEPEWLEFCLSAAYDLAVSGVYTRELLDDEAHFTQSAIGSSETVAFFPYTWMCPLRVSEGRPPSDCYLPGAKRVKQKDYPISEMLAKPGGRMIGDVGIMVLKSIFRCLLQRNGSSAIMRDGGGFRGEFDLSIIDDQLMVFVEVKAKPLVSYPLKVTLKESRQSSAMEWIKIGRDDAEHMALFMGATGVDIPISLPTDPLAADWPFDDLTDYISDLENCQAAINNWSKHLAGYRKWEGEDPRTRWIRFGCGNFSDIEDGERVEKRVANTKELPGLDRTDDIKKGAAQMLKFARFKFDCPADSIRCVLAGNTWAETHSEHYIEPIVDLRIRKGDMTLEQEVWIFDAIIGLTVNQFNKQDLEEYFSFQ